MKLRDISIAILVSLSVYTGQGLASPDDHLIVTGDYFCPTGYRLMSYSQAVDNREKLCNGLKDWAVVRLAGMASLSGAANNCELYKVDHRGLGKSICTPMRDFSSIRGILLRGGFFSQAQLTDMANQDWRQALVTALANRTAGLMNEYEKLSNEALTGAGELLLYHMNNGTWVPEELARMTIEDLRKSVLNEINWQTGIPIVQLGQLSDRELMQIFYRC